MKALALFRNRFGTLSFPKFKLPAIVMPWTRAIRDLNEAAQIHEELIEALRQRITTLELQTEALESDLEDTNKQFDNTELVTRCEVESMVDDTVEEQLGADLEDAVTDQISRAFAQATFDVEVSL